MTRTRRRGQARDSSETSAAQVSGNVSALSRNSSAVRDSSAAMAPCSSVRPGASRTSSAAAMASITRSGSLSGATSTNHTPSGKDSSRLSASRSARRVLPEPPMPTSERSLASPSAAEQSDSVRSRPTKLVAGVGRLCRAAGTSPARSASARRIPRISSSAIRTACMPDGRRAGSFSRHRATNSRAVAGVRDGIAAKSGAASSVARMTSMTVAPGNARRPARHSYRTAPSAKTSVRSSSSPARTCSGLM